MQVVSRRESAARAPWLHSLTAAQEEDHEDHTDTEGETEEEEESDTEENKLSEVRGREAEWDQHASGSRGPVRGREAEAQGETGSLPPSHPNPPPPGAQRHSACLLHRSPHLHTASVPLPQLTRTAGGETARLILQMKKRVQRGKVTCPRPHSWWQSRAYGCFSLVSPVLSLLALGVVGKGRARGAAAGGADLALARR